MSLLGFVARTCFRNASWYKVLRIRGIDCSAPSLPDPRITSIEQNRLSESKCPVMREQEWYGGKGTRLYAYIEDGEVGALCCYWFGERYLARNFWPLHDREAKLVQVITSPTLRGKGIATALIAQSAADMFAQGFVTLYARVWFSNKASLRAFGKAGWCRIAQVIDFKVLGMEKDRRVVFWGKV